MGSPTHAQPSPLRWKPNPEDLISLRLRFLHSTGLPLERKAGGGRSLKSSFPFTQELPKYLRGFHKCSREDAIHLAGLIYKARFGDDRPQPASIPKILRELVPENLTRLMSLEEWKKVLVGGWGGGRQPLEICEILLHFRLRENTFDSKTVHDLIMKLTSSRACFLKTYYPE